MKLKKISLACTAALVLGLAGCSKSESVTPATDDVNKTVSSAADAVAKTAEATKAEAVKAVDAAKTEVAKAADNSKAQELIDKAKSLVAENKFADASTVLQQLAGQSLSGEQQALVTSLKEQIQKVLAAKATDNAAGTVGNLLQK
jgi:hypothetical protein